MMTTRTWCVILIGCTIILGPALALAESEDALALAESEKDCGALPDHPALKAALDAAVSAETSGLDFHMWATIVNRDGVVCAVAYSGSHRGSQWLGSRVIAAQKANTANAFNIDGFALSTANLFSAVQPGGSLFGLQHSNPIDTRTAYKGPAKNFGQPNDPMVGTKPGGINVFGGGLGLYDVLDGTSTIVGGLGLSGDTSCADHMIAWRVRNNLGYDNVTGGVSGDPDRPDNIIYDIIPNPDGGTGTSASGFGHPQCLNTGDPMSLPPIQ